MSSPKKNVAYDFYVSLVDSADTGSFKVDPTIAAGDFKVSGSSGGPDATAFTDLDTIPVVDPSGAIGVLVRLSQAEMNFNKIMVQCIDAAGAEWDDVLIFIDATIVNIDDVAGVVWQELTADHNDVGTLGRVLGEWQDGNRLEVILEAVLIDTGVTLNTHLTDIKGSSFVKDTHSLIDIETQVNAVKVVTDKFQFTATNILQSDVQYVNAVQLQGTGVIGDEWRPV